MSCSTSERANRHLKRAIKLDPTIVHTHRDTVVKTISDTGDVYFYGDTMVENNFVFISVKHEGQKTNLYWYLKSIKIEFPVDNTFITPPQTRQEIRLKYRTITKYKKEETKVKVAEIKQNNRTKRVELRSAAKATKKEKRKINYFLLGLVIGFLISQVVKIITLIKKLLV
jgi:hypothetical protein